MFFLIPMQLTNQPTRPRFAIANLMLIFSNVFIYLIFSAETWWVGPGTMPWTILTYGFVHMSFFHLLFNMWFLWVFGNAVNRRVGDFYYLLIYLGAIIGLGILGRLFCNGYLLGSSGGVYAILGVALLLLPAARVEVHYLALCPLTLLIGLIRRPKFGLFWFVRWGVTHMPAIALIGFYVICEFVWVMWLAFYWEMSWSNFGHLLGFLCGLVAVLLLPSRISMGRQASFT